MTIHPQRRLWLDAANIPRRFRDRLLPDLGPYREDGHVRGQIEDWITAILEGRVIAPDSPDEACGLGLCLSGAPGQGKTALACAVLQTLILRARSSTWRGTQATLRRPAFFATYPEVLDIAKKAMSDEPGSEDLLDSMFARGPAPISVLVLDDLGKEHRTTSKWAENLFDHLLRSRFDKGYPTIVTTNVAVSNWGPYYGESMASFAHEAFILLGIISPEGDRRR